jgi:hypothetical protein
MKKGGRGRADEEGSERYTKSNGKNRHCEKIMEHRLDLKRKVCERFQLQYSGDCTNRIEKYLIPLSFGLRHPLDYNNVSHWYATILTNMYGENAVRCR